MRRSIAITLSGVAIAVAACSGKTGTANRSATSSPPVFSTSPTSTAPVDPVAHVGATLNLTGDRGPLAVTLTKIINPATGTSGPPTDDKGNPRGTYVAAMLTVHNTSTSARKDDANNDAVLVGSDNQDYSTALGSVTECTNFDEGEYELRAGESVNGCVVFVMPPGVKPAKFKYTPSSGFANSFGEWLIP